MYKRLIDEAYNRCIEGISLTKEQIVRLLEIEPSCADADYLRRKAGDAAFIISGGKAYLWGAMGIDYVPCSMNCAFCSFGEEWKLIKAEKTYSDEQIIEQMREYVDSGVHFIVVRTTEFFSIDELCIKVRNIRKAVPGNYELILNIGEFGYDDACKMYEAGVDGIYHAVRLREGIDTGFDTEVRNATMNAVHQSPLKLISLVEPVGPEHTNEEIAENFINLVKHGTAISGTMARVPVKGTPLGDRYEIISDERIAQIIAVLRLASGRTVPDICVHPASELAISSGANVTVIETGAVPRTQDVADDKWRAFTPSKARDIFEKIGYAITR